jgi:hypothetical protein
VERHLRTYEPHLRVDLVLVDQGSTAAARAALARQHRFAVRVAAGEARGYGWPFNVGFFGVCRAPFVAVIEDDFPLVDAAALTSPAIFAGAMGLLRQVPKALGVVLKSDDWIFDHGLCQEERRSVNGWSNVTLCVAKNVFGSYTNSAAVYDRRRLAEIGRQHEGPHGTSDPETPEGRFSLASKAKGMGLLFVERYKEKQSKPWRGVAVHTGGALSTGRGDSTCRKGPKYVMYD